MFQEITQNDSLRIQLPTDNGANTTPSFNIPRKQIDASVLERVSSSEREIQENDSIEKTVTVTRSYTPKREIIEISPMTSRFGNREKQLEQYTEKPSIPFTRKIEEQQ